MKANEAAATKPNLITKEKRQQYASRQMCYKSRNTGNRKPKKTGRQIFCNAVNKKK